LKEKSERRRRQIPAARLFIPGRLGIAVVHLHSRTPQMLGLALPRSHFRMTRPLREQGSTSSNYLTLPSRREVAPPESTGEGKRNKKPVKR